VQEGVRLESIGATPAEEAFLTAIAVAQGQKAKSFELQAVMPRLLLARRFR
jgi:hypothetical protein